MITDFLEPVALLDRDIIRVLRASPGELGAEDIRILVDLYYMMQKNRLRANNQLKAIERHAKQDEVEQEPHAVIQWARGQFEVLEKQVLKTLGAYSYVHPMGWFFEQTVGIGPVISAGMLAHIDVTRQPTAGHLWSFAGLNPTVRAEKGQKRPWNGRLKTLCWKAGESFAKTSNLEGAYYGRIYKARKDYEWRKNLAGDYAGQAAAKLEAYQISKGTDAYAWYSGGIDAGKALEMWDAGDTPATARCKGQGHQMLPPDHIYTRAKRYAVKLFLAHLWQRWREELGLPIARPYPIEHMGHVHWIEPPQTK